MRPPRKGKAGETYDRGRRKPFFSSGQRSYVRSVEADFWADEDVVVSRRI